MLWLTMGCRGWGSGNHFWNQHPSRPSTALRRLMHCCGWGVGFQCGWLWDSLPARNSDPITLEELHEGPPPWLQVGLQMFMINPSMDMSTIYIIYYIYIYMYTYTIYPPIVFSPKLPVGPFPVAEDAGIGTRSTQSHGYCNKKLLCC